MRCVKSEVSKVFTLELTDEEVGTIVSNMAVSLPNDVLEYAEKKSLKITDSSNSDVLFRSLDSLVE